MENAHQNFEDAGNENEADLIDFTPDMIFQENSLEALRNLKSDLLVLHKGMRNMKMGIQRDFLQMSIKFNGKIAAINLALEENKAFLIESRNEFNQMIEQKFAEFEAKNIAKNKELMKEIGELRAENEGLKNENANLKEEIGQIIEKFNELNAKIESMIEKKSKLNSPIANIGKIMVESEQKSEEINSERVKNLFKTNVELNDENEANKMENALEMKQKWNALDCSPNLSISGNELILTHSGSSGFNSARATLPISKFSQNAKKPYIGFYFEVQIIKKADYGIRIGFCSKYFPLLKEKGTVNLIGIHSKVGMTIDGFFQKFENVKGVFNEGDVVGIGLIYSSAAALECFASHNGKFLGCVYLPPKFLRMELYPAASLYRPGDSIKANFGEEKWSYNPGHLL